MNLDEIRKEVRTYIETTTETAHRSYQDQLENVIAKYIESKVTDMEAEKEVREIKIGKLRASLVDKNEMGLELFNLNDKLERLKKIILSVEYICDSEKYSDMADIIMEK